MMFADDRALKTSSNYSLSLEISETTEGVY